MKITKNKKRIDPRYFLNETAVPHRRAGEHILHDEVIRMYCQRHGGAGDPMCEDTARCLLDRVVNDMEISDPIHRGGAADWSAADLLEEMEALDSRECEEAI
tara:strand:+ start:4386 stop:4691 length:306 start_codon:yes stop_codon:yes gene_type:complete